MGSAACRVGLSDGPSRVALDPDAFPAAYPRVVWSSSSYAGYSSDRWYVQFTGGNEVRSTWYTPLGVAGVRCVRLAVGGIRAGGGRFTRTTPVGDGQPVVADSVTGLVWQGCPAGQAGSGCAGSASGYHWEEALAYCEGLDWGGHTDWSLPNVRELASVTDDRRFGPAIDSTAFPNTGSDEFWSSTTNSGEYSCGLYHAACECARSVDFLDGRVTQGWPKADARLGVRCVRRGP